MTSLRHNLPVGAEADREPRDAYLDSARACILDVGWRRTTLTEVARRAGVSRMTIYRTWADMPTLLGDLMTREWAGVVTDQVAAAGSATSLQRLVGGIVGTVRMLRANELFVRIVELDPELILPYLFSRRGRSQDLILALSVEAIEAGQADGSIRPGDPKTMARAVLLAVHGFVLSAHTMADEGVDEEALDEELTTLLTRSLAA
jgi:AcrR family transcriptional regulator